MAGSAQCHHWILYRRRYRCRRCPADGQKRIAHRYYTRACYRLVSTHFRHVHSLGGGRNRPSRSPRSCNGFDAMTEPVVDARNITKVFGTGGARVEALKSVSLTLPDAQLTLLMGPSGSGKTTLLSILGCMLTPD